MRYNRISLVLSVLVILVLSMLSACSGAGEPDNLEPVLLMQPVENVTRNEAMISVRVENRGIGRLSYIRFHYGESVNTDCISEALVPETEIISIRLQGLKPGTEYYCYAEGITSTARLVSATVSFTTESNNRPSLSSPEALSTGPIGIIIGFCITEDGGEAITEAGCIVESAATGEAMRLYLPSACLVMGEQRMNINGLVPETSYTITPFATNSIGETVGEPLRYTTSSSIVLEKAGELESLLGSKVQLSKLTITGEMNGDDFRFLRQLLGAPFAMGERPVESEVVEVDLTDTRIVEGGGSYDGSRFTENDIITTGLFANCRALLDILLPSTATRIARNAFADCSALETLMIPASIADLIPSGGCTSLRAIEVSRANEHYVAVDGVLFNSDVTEVLWFPLGKTGPYSLPSTITVIGESAFAGTAITSLTIPSSVKKISRGAFAASALEEISLPDNITNISEGMFQGCGSLVTVYLGRGTEYVGNYVFDGTALKNLYVGASIPPVAAQNAFVNQHSSIVAGCTLHVPAGSKKIYQNHRMWGSFAKIVEF